MGNPWSDDSGGWADQLYGSNPLSNNFNVQPLDSSGPTSPGISNPWSVKPIDYASTPDIPGPVTNSQPSPSKWNGIFDNPIVHGVGDAVDFLGHLPGINNATGAMKGLEHGYFNYTPDPKNPLDFGLGAAGNSFKEGWQGLIHPDQARQNVTKDITPALNNPTLPAWVRVLNNFTEGSNDFLSVAPIGPVVKGVSDLTHLTPVITAAADAIKASKAVNNPVVNGMQDIYGTLFKKGYGTSADTMPTMNGLGNTVSADQYAIMHKMDELGQAHGLSPSQLDDMAHHLDGRPTLDPQVQQAAKELSDILSGGFDSAHGRVYGTDAELRNTHTGSAPSLQQLFAQNAGNPIRAGAVENYYPRRFNNTPDEVAAALEQYNGLQKGLSTNGVFNKAREFPTLQDAIDHGLTPEMNPYLAIGQRLGETSKAVNTDNAIKQLQYAGVVKDAHEPGLKETTTNPFTSYIKNVTDPKTGEESSFINRSYMKPADESYIQRALDPQGAKTTAENVLDKVGKYTGYDPTINLLKKASLVLSPQVHAHNIIDNGMYLGGAKASDTLSTMNNLRKGIHDPDYEKALASGAISSDLKGTGFSDALRNQVAPENKNFFQKALDGIKYGTHDALWDADKGLRTSINKQVLEGGGTAAEAADKTNKFLVNYKNTTPFEDSVMKRIFPFYSWMKGNMPMQAEQWINNTPKQMFAHRSINAGSQALSGNDDHNGKMDTGLRVSDGSHTMFDPYVASEDPVKMLHDTPIPFLFNRMNPFLKMGLEEMTNKKYSPFPMTAAPDKQYLNKPEIRLAGPEAQDSGYNTKATIAHIANALNPVGSGVLGNAVGATGGDARSYIEKALGVNKKDKFGNDVDKPSATWPELLLPLTGGFTSRYNPDKEANSKAYSDKQNLRDDISFKKSRGEQVSKGEKKAANRKVVQ